ncbi:hypothetical protein NE237_003727 [Protea cynaroides]|uniref:Small ribosomal subunit protein uS7 domain-containing protein n=1 Tax=Protea cynaroides TaxID=273540 RepID=A0A9Q0KHC9_9MAGN|nr:hypothetical protein NE237_003727 [Protea cynaroides]
MEIAARCTLFCVSLDIVHYLCLILASPLFLMNDLVVTISSVALSAFKELVSKAFYDFLPRVTLGVFELRRSQENIVKTYFLAAATGGEFLHHDQGLWKTLKFASAAMAVVAQPEVKLFNRWTFEDVQVGDISLVDYIGVSTSKHATFIPHTAGRYSAKRFRKAQCPIVERLTNSLMMHGRNNGKKLMAVRIIKHAMEIIHLLTDLNPIQVIVDAVINSGPREDATRIGSAGVVRRQAVDISPLRRVNQAIYLLTTGARESAFRNIKTIAECLADELINAAKGSSNSYAIKKKDEIERVAKANR